jgi:hypothetical protein
MTDEEQKVSDLETALETERGEYARKISEIIKMIYKIDRVAEAQVLMLSFRHMMVEKLAKYRSAIYNKKSNDANFRKLRYEYYKTAHNIKLDYKEINDFINSDMSLRIRQTNLLENQLTFYTQCIETLDRMGYSIKNVVSIAEMNHRNS